MKEKINLLLLSNLFIAIPGIIFLAWIKVDAGYIYAFMFLAVTSLIFWVNELSKQKDMSFLKRFVAMPFFTGTTLAVFLYLIGWLIPIVLKIAFAIANVQFSVTQLSVPLFSKSITAGIQSFTVAQTAQSMPWIIFTNVFVSGNVETYTYNYGTILIGFILGLFLWTLISKQKSSTIIGFSKKAFITIVAFFISLVTFVLSHLLNKTYDTAGMFVIAAVFLFAANFSIYFLGLLLSFWAGFHQSNNLLSLMFNPKTGYGFWPVMQGFLSLFGVLFVLYMFLLVYYLINHWPEIRKDWHAYFLRSELKL